MKGGREHRVPLSAPVIALLKRMRGQAIDFVFPGLKAGEPLSNMQMLVLLGRMGRGEVTAHGFRASARLTS